MAPTRYSLHYEDYSEHLMSRFGKLLQLQSLVDMTLMCSSHTLRVHKAVLAASSAYFQEVLQNQTGEPLIILKMRFSVLKSLVEFMYCGKTQCLEENLDELVSAAQFLKIKGLSKVTKEGLGIANNNELPVFTPPVVISRPPQSLIELNSQEVAEPKLPTPHPVAPSSQPMESIRSSKEMVVRIPFDIEKGGGGGGYQDPPRPIKPRRGRPTARRSGWEGPGLGRAAERALLRREQDSRKAIHHLKHLQSRHMQEYMDQVTLTQAVNSICGPESSHNYMNIDNNYMYMEQPGSSGIPPAAPYAAETPRAHEAPAYTAPTSASEPNSIGTAMSQYVNALKNAGLPTDLPILFESGDGSYVNVNEQVLMDMVQSSEIQYEVIDQPSIIHSVADPDGIKSIDDLSKSIERGEMLMDVKNYPPPSFDKNSSYRHEDAINSLDSILPDNLESFGDQQNYVVLDSHLTGGGGGLDPNMTGGSLDSHLAGGTLDASADFSCIDGDMQFFTKSMSDDVKKYYSSQTLDDARDLGLGPAGAALDTSFTISLLDSKTSHMNTNNPQDLTRNDDCYDFGLPLPQMKDFKEDALDCLIATPKRNDDDNKMLNRMDDDGADERAKIIKDLMNIEKTMNLNRNVDEIDNPNEKENAGNAIDFSMSLNEVTFEAQRRKDLDSLEKRSEELTPITPGGLQWDGIDLSQPAKQNTDNIEINEEIMPENENHNNQGESKAQSREYDNTNACITESVNCNIDSTIDEDIPFAVGLQPLRPAAAGDSPLKRRSPVEHDLLDNMDAKCLRRKAKHKKL